MDERGDGFVNGRRVLICDDSEAVHESLKRFLNDANIETVSVYDGSGALKRLEREAYDLIILDIMLLDMSGMDVCRRVRAKSSVPILFLSARSEEIDRVLGLELGGDDYVTKPFSPREVSLRVQKILARSQPERQETHTVSFEELSADTETLEISVDGKKIDMTAKEVQLLIYLIRNARKVLNREQILSAIWGYDYFGDTRAVDAAIKRIRKKLPDAGVHFSVQSIYGVGYRLGETGE